MNKEQEYLINLVKANIDGIIPALPEEPFNWQYLSAFAEEQQFEQLLYPLIKDKPELPVTSETRHHLHQRYGRVISRSIMQDMDLAEICDEFSKNGIAHIPLKGSVIRHYYPLQDIRRSGDFDILIHEEDRIRAGIILKQLGYAQKSKNQVMDDCFFRDKNYLELHFMLASPTDPSHTFLLKVWDYSHIKKEYTYEMQPEFLYTYLLSHLYRHLSGGGGGIKLIADFYVLKKQVKFDDELLAKFIKEAHLENLFECVNKLIDKWFYGADITDKFVFLTEQLLTNGGAYNNREIGEKIRISQNVQQKQSKIGRVLDRAFPSAEYLKIRYPILKKYKILLPVMWVRRLTDFRVYNPLLTVKAINQCNDEETMIFNEYSRYISE